MRQRFRPFLACAALVATASAAYVTAQTGLAVPRDDQKTRYPAFEVGAVHPLEFDAGGTALWVVNQPGNRLVKLDPTSLQRQVEIPLGLGAASVIARPGSDELWVVDRVQGCVTIVSRTAMAITRTVRVGAEPHSLCFSPTADRAWVTCSGANAVDVISTSTYAVVQSISIPAREPRGIAWSAGRVWVASFLSGNGTSVAGTSTDPLDARTIGTPHAPVKTPLPDRDLFAIVPGPLGSDTLDPAATKSGLGTTLFNVNARPGTSELWIPNTNALNEGHVGQASFVDGRFVSNRITVVDAAGVQPTRVLDLDVLAPAGVRCAQPTCVAFNPSGTRAYVTGYGSDNVVIFDVMPNGGLVWRGYVSLPPRFGYPAGTQPRACVVSPDGNTLYVLNKNDVSVARIPLTTLPQTIPFAVTSALPLTIGFEASSGEERLGRHLFTDAYNSKSLTSSCASCHVDGHTDGIAWDLSDYLDPPTTPAAQMMFGTDVKGPMVTQSTRRLEESGPYHWRGEKHHLNEFNDSFITLLKREENGVPTNVGADFQYLRHFIDRLAWPANPKERPDRTLSSAEQHGADLFMNRPVLNGMTCASCHTLPLGSRGEVVAETAGGVIVSADVPQLRGVGTKEGTSMTVGAEYGTRPELGTGLTHAGVFATLEQTILRPDHVNPGQPHFALTASEAQDIAAFLRAFDTGLAPATAFQTTARPDNLPAFRSDLAYLVAQAELGNCDLVVLRTPPVGSTPATFARTGMYLRGRGLFQLADSTVAPIGAPVLIEEARAGRPVTFVGVPLGCGRSRGIDRDMDWLYDVDEARLGTNPDVSDTDGDRFPDGYEVSLGMNPLAVDADAPLDTTTPHLVGPAHLVYATTNTLKFEFQTSEPCRVHVHVNGGPPLQRLPLDHQFDNEHWCILNDLQPGTSYTVNLELRDPELNIVTDSSTVLTTLSDTFADPAHVDSLQLSVASIQGQDVLTGVIALKDGSAAAGAGYVVHTSVYRLPQAGALQMMAQDLPATTTALGTAVLTLPLSTWTGPSTWYVAIEGVDVPAGSPPWVLAHDVVRYQTIVY